MNWIMSVILGYFVGYHVDTVLSQVHDKQTDLKEVGYLFCCMFLPGANFWVLGNILAFNSRSWDGVILYQQLVWKLSVENLKYFASSIGAF